MLPEACNQDGVAHTVTPPETVIDLMVGQWAQCSGIAWFGSQDAAGLEITKDYHWYKLVWDTTGTLVRGDGSNSTGTWEVLPSQQVNFYNGNGGSLNFFADFVDGPRKMRFNGPGYGEGIFALVQTAASAELKGKIQIACTPDGTEFAASSTDQLLQLFVGRWASCTSPTFFGTADDGLEITQDGHWFKLRIDDTGQWVHKDGFDSTGTWECAEPCSVGNFAINLIFPSSGTLSVSLKFVTGPLKMQAEATPGPSVFVKDTELP